MAGAQRRQGQTSLSWVASRRLQMAPRGRRLGAELLRRIRASDRHIKLLFELAVILPGLLAYIGDFDPASALLWPRTYPTLPLRGHLLTELLVDKNELIELACVKVMGLIEGAFRCRWLGRRHRDGQTLASGSKGVVAGQIFGLDLL